MGCVCVHASVSICICMCEYTEDTEQRRVCSMCTVSVGHVLCVIPTSCLCSLSVVFPNWRVVLYNAIYKAAALYFETESTITWRSSFSGSLIFVFVLWEQQEFIFLFKVLYMLLIFAVKDLFWQRWTYATFAMHLWMCLHSTYLVVCRFRLWKVDKRYQVFDLHTPVFKRNLTSWFLMCVFKSVSVCVCVCKFVGLRTVGVYVCAQTCVHWGGIEKA